MAEVAQQTLHVVARELGTTLGEARAALETFAEQPSSSALLDKCAASLHEVHGVLRLVEVYGAALLAEEMEQVARYLIESAAENRNQPESLDALMRAMVQLPAYLERVLGGGRDLALVLLPLLNDLRAVRGNALLSEGTLLLLNLTSDRQPQPPGQQPGEPLLTVAQWARRLRPRFQVGLLGWIKGERPAQHLEIMAAVAERLEQVATRQPVFQLWWVVGATLESLRDGGLESTATLKRLLGQADRELKRLYETGEGRYAEAPPLDLLNNLLYYVARATGTGPRASAVRASFKLQDLLPVSEQVEQEREKLSAPSVRLMQTVAAAIKEDLSRIKDVLDIFVRKGSTHVEELAAQLDMLRKISDTLGVLGLGDLRQKVQLQIQRLHEIIGRRAPPSDGVLVDIAATLISVEDNLDAQLVRLIMPGEGRVEVELDAEFQHVQNAVLRECIVNLARVKETIAAVVANQEPAGTDQVPQLLRGLTAGLLMLGRARAVEAVEAIGQHVLELLRPNRRVVRAQLERLADAIVSVEYYMETLQSGRRDPWYMLDNAEACLRALREHAGSALADSGTHEHAPRFEGFAAGGAAWHATPAAAATPGAARASAPSAAAQPALDPDLVALFVEEAREELAKIQQQYLRWEENPLDGDALASLRRSFHTLKGSGRMVGARNIGEFAWAIESLLNRLMSGTLARTQGMLALLREAVAVLPELVEQLASGRAPGSNVGLVIGRAHAFAEGRDAEQALAVALEARGGPQPSGPPAATALASSASISVMLAPGGTVVLPRPDLAPPPPVPAAPAAPAAASTPRPSIARPMDPGSTAVLERPDLAPPPVPAAPAAASTPRPSIAQLMDPGRTAVLERPDLEPPAATAAPAAAAEPLFPPRPGAPVPGEASLIATEVLLSHEPAPVAARPVRAAPPVAVEPAAGSTDAAPSAPAGAMPRSPARLPTSVSADLSTLEVGARFVRAEDLEPKSDGGGHAAVPPPPPSSGSEFRMAVPDAAAASSDPVLLDIYRGEVSTHLQNVRQYLESCVGKYAPYPVTEALHRACHTVAGASKMAGVRHGIKITEPLNLYVRKLYDHGLGLPEAGRRVLADAVAAVEQGVAHMEESTDFFTLHADLLARLKWLDADADREIATHGLAARDGAASGEFPAAPVGQELLAADAMLEAVPAAAPPRAPSRPDGSDEFDAEIAVIFSEEATELLEAADAALTAFRADSRETGRITELKRGLHTLKGGARMAGVVAMGDLAHEVESLLIQTEAEGTSGDARTLEVLQASLDELNRMRDTVSAGRPVGVARDLVTRLRALSRAHAAPPVLRTVAGEIAATPPPLPAVPSPAQAQAPPPVVSEIAATQRTRVSLADLAAAAARIDAPAAPAAAGAAGEAVPPGPAAAAAPAAETEPVAEAELAAEAEPAVAAESATAAAIPAELLVREQSMEGSRTFALPPGREPGVPAERQELARVDAELLDNMLNSAGEVSIFRARLEQQFSSIEFNLAELTRVVARLKDQLRNLELETEAQIVNRHEVEGRRRDDFDPLEMDRYSSLHQYSRALAESTSDVASVQSLLEQQTREAQNLLMQQARAVTDLQNGLMRTRMVPFQRHLPRLTRIVRQAAAESGKKVELVVSGGSGEVDRQVLERMLPPFEHMLRNAVVHGIEPPGERLARGKAETGRIEIALRREGAEVVIVVTDDGAGMNLRAIRDKAVALGMIDPRQSLSDEEAMQLILEPGFSTASTVTQAAGRGVGMDVVATEIKKLGGALHMDSTAGKGTRFTTRLPFTLAVAQALIVRAGDEVYALPLPTVESVVRLPRSEVLKHLAEDGPPFEYGGQRYRMQHLGSFVGGRPAQLPDQELPVPVILIRAGDSSTGLVTDELIGSREIVVKSVGPQIAGIRGIAGATILGDGRIVIILDMGALVRGDWRLRPVADSSRARGTEGDRRTFALVVDDSITVRRVTQRLLERNGMRVMTAKDGVDAMSIMQEHVPDVILLDIEMPRMDGYEVAAQVRADPRLKHVPIVMITSRVGEKHRARAIELGVDDYLGKPYQENQLLDAIEPLVSRRREAM